jgi:DHA1 family multidrug resistance protein-like MFS transporter
MIITVVGAITVLIQLIVTGPATRRWGEALLIRASLLGSAVGFVLMLQATTFPTVLFTVSLFIISNAMLRPGVMSLISKRTTGGQGMAMGLANSFMSMGRIAGPIWAGLVFDINIDYPYLSGALIMLIAFVASLVWLTKEPPVLVGEEIVHEPLHVRE